MYINKEMSSHFFILCTFRFYFTNIYSSKKKMNSAFKANVHLNIISLASLFFRAGKKRSFQTTWTVSCCGSAFRKYANVGRFTFLSSQVSLFVRRFHVKYKTTFCVFSRLRDLQSNVQALENKVYCPKSSSSKAKSVWGWRNPSALLLSMP